MLGFLNSFVLPALAAAAVPLIIHFFYRRRSKTVLFSSIRFLKLLESKRIKHLRIYQLLLVLIRMLFILALVAAFARPVIKSVFFTNRSANTTAVILLDDSYSMQTITPTSDYFQEAKRSLKTILKTFGKDDKVYLLLTSRKMDSPQLLNTDLPKDINSLNPGYSAQNLKTAFAEAFRLFKKHINFNRELYLISDLRINETLFPDSLTKKLTAGQIQFFLLNPAKDHSFANIAIDTVDIKNQIIEQNKPFFLSARLQNHNATEAQETRIHLFNGQKRLAMKSVTIPAGASAEVSFSVLPEHAGPLALHLEIDSDDLAADNFYYFNVSVAGKLRLLYVGEPAAGPLSAALTTLREQSSLQITALPFARLKHINLNTFNAVLLYDPPMPDNGILYRLKQFNQSGHSLLFLPGDKTTPLILNTFLHSLSGQKPFSILKSVPGGEGYFSTQKGFEHNDLFRPFFKKPKNNLAAPEIFRFYPLRPAGASLILLQNGFPLLTFYKGKTNAARVYIFSSALDLEWNTLPLQGFFVPLLQRLFYQAGLTAEPAVTGQTDRPLVLHFPGFGLRDRFMLKQPSGETLPLNPSVETNGIVLSVKAPLAPGQYQLLKNGQPVKLFSINVSANELQEPYYQFDTWEQTISELKNDQTLLERIKQTRHGYELWPFFTGIAFLLLLLEILLIKRIEGNNERTSA